MNEQIITAIISAVCMAIGYGLGQMRVHRFAGEVKTLESHVEMCRRSLLENKEELGNIYKHLQTMDAAAQKREISDLDEITRMMKNAVIGGEMPRPLSPNHPGVGSAMGSLRATGTKAGATQ